MAFGLGGDLAPEVLGKRCCGTAQDANEVIFPGLDGFFGEVATLIIWWYVLESHVGGFDFVAIERRDFVVEDLMLWLDALVSHACEGAATCQNHLPLCFVFHWLHPSGVAVNVVEEHLILVAAAGT